MRLTPLKLVTFLVASWSIAAAGAAQDASQQKPKPTAAEMTAQAESMVASGTMLSQTVNSLIRQATEDADMLKVTCLTDKATQIEGNLSTARQHLEALKSATDDGVRSHQYTMISVIDSKLNVLGQQAGQCVGKELYETGTTTVDTVVDTDMLPFEDNPSVPPMVLPPSLPTLPPASTGMR